MTVPRGVTVGVVLPEAGRTTSETDKTAANSTRTPPIEASQADKREDTSTIAWASIGKHPRTSPASPAFRASAVGTLSPSLLESTSRYGRLEADYRAHPAGSHEQRPRRPAHQPLFEDT